MATRPTGKSSASGGPTSGTSSSDHLTQAESLYRSGRNTELLASLDGEGSQSGPSEAGVRVSMLRGMALFDIGRIVDSIGVLTAAHKASESCTSSLQFLSAFALFVRKADFEAPDELLPGLTRLRQLASLVGDARSLASLHLA